MVNPCLLHSKLLDVCLETPKKEMRVFGDHLEFRAYKEPLFFQLMTEEQIGAV